MALDKAKFGMMSSRGIFPGDAAGYREWARYADELKELLRAHKEATGLLSNITLTMEHPTYVELLALAKQRPEDAVHALVHQMMSGFSHVHLALLRELTDENPTPSEAAGKMHAAIAAWLLWYEANAYGDGP